jgi:hypothetical protein
MSSKRVVATMVVAFMVVLCVSVVLAAKDNPMGVAAKQTLSFSEPTVVGGMLLPAGDYTVTHEMQGQTHIMIFKQVDGKAEVKTTCTLVPLNAKAQRSEQRFTENAKNQKVLVEMTFRGDTAKHVLAQ